MSPACVVNCDGAQVCEVAALKLFKRAARRKRLSFCASRFLMMKKVSPLVVCERRWAAPQFGLCLATACGRGHGHGLAALGAVT